MSAALRELQRQLQNYLLAPETIPEGLIVETAAVPQRTRLGIYANAYRARIVEALGVDYRGLRSYLGDAAFERLALAYIAAHPSRQRSLRRVGAQLAEFIRATPPYDAHRDLHELAQFEWALCHAFDAADAMPLDSEMLAALPPERWAELALQFTPTLRTLTLHTNAPALWQALQNDAPPPAVEEGAAQTWLVWRRQLKLLFRTADAVEAIALRQFLRGISFGDVCASLADHLPADAVPARAVALLQQWLCDELVVRDA